MRISGREVFLLDCDPGIDDALALGYLLAAPGVQLIGVTTVFGNVPPADGARNALALLDLAGRAGIPVAVGADSPLDGGHYDAGRSATVHAGNGLGGVELPEPSAGTAPESAVDLLLRLSVEHPGRLHLIAIGPLTNLAHALRADPSFAQRVAHVTVMGGAAHAPGNATPAAEANIWHDPEAAQLVLTADWDVTVVPLDATMSQLLEEDHRQLLMLAGSGYATAVGEMLAHYSEFYSSRFDRPVSVLHDPLAAAVAVGEVAVELGPRVPVQVDCTDGPGRGATIFDLRGRYRGYPDVPGERCRVVLQASADFAELLSRRLISLP